MNIITNLVIINNELSRSNLTCNYYQFIDEHSYWLLSLIAVLHSLMSIILYGKRAIIRSDHLETNHSSKNANNDKINVIGQQLGETHNLAYITKTCKGMTDEKPIAKSNAFRRNERLTYLYLLFFIY